MNAEDLRKLPQFIDGSGGGMWRIVPDDFVPEHRPAVYVRLDDVLVLLAQEKESNA